MNSRILRVLLLAWCLFIGVGALFGGVSMLLDPTGGILQMQSLLPYFQALPFADVLFQDYTFSGIALLMVNGAPNLLAAWLLLRRKPLGAKLGTVFGFTLMLWIMIQFVIFPANPLSTSYFFFGLMQCVTGHLLLIASAQEAFRFDPADYPNVGRDGRTLVVCYSRRGYVRKLAWERADALGADVAELETPEPTKGATGFLWCGRFAMHGWPMPTRELVRDPAAYDLVVLCTPVWCFSVSAPMRDFCRWQAGRLPRVEYVIVHFRRRQSVRRAADTMSALLRAKPERITDCCCHFGRVVAQREEGQQTPVGA